MSVADVPGDVVPLRQVHGETAVKRFVMRRGRKHSSGWAEGDGERLDAANDHYVVPNQLGFVDRKVDVVGPGQQRGYRDLGFQASERRAQAHMEAKAETHVAADRPGDVHPSGWGKRAGPRFAAVSIRNTRSPLAMVWPPS